ncbi:family 43 glycosylhydrolase [Neobacillus sp. Marseille-QA0830]
MKRVLGIFMTIFLIAGMFSQPIKSHAADPTTDGHGLLGEFFKVERNPDNREDINVFNFNDFRGERRIANLNGDSFLSIFNQFSGTPDYNTARFTGTIVPKYSEDYTFYMIGDDGFRLWINGELVIDFWQQKWEIQQDSAPIHLEAGKHYDIKVEYLQGWGGAWLRMEWESASQKREIVPESALYLPINRVIEEKKGDLTAEIQKADYLTENFADKVSGSVIETLNHAKAKAEELIRTIDDKNVEDRDKADLLIKEAETLSITRSEFMKEMGVTSSSVFDKFNNPLYQGQDPFITYKDGYYYFVSSSNLDSNNKVYVSRSRTLTDQGEKVMVYDSKGTQTRIFAPEIFFFDGKWYIYYCADLKDYGYRHMATVLESISDDPLGEYVSKGALYTGEKGEFKQANDFTVFEYNGQLYAVWGTLGAGEPVGPAIAPMENPYTIKADRSLLPGGGGEGPRVLQRDGKVFITVSEGDYQSNGYRLSYFMNTDGDILNSNSWNRTNNVFVATSDVSGPARAGFVKSADGMEDWMIYHSRVYKDTGRNWWRQVNIKKFGWNQDGTPNFGEPVSPYAWQELPSGDPGQGDMYQAEDAIHYGGITKGQTYKNYQGNGYINLPKSSGAEASFVVNAKEAGDYIVGVRYAYGEAVNGEYTNNPSTQLPARAKVNVYVNGVFVKTITPDKTSISWEEWFTASERLNLQAGKNVISYRIDNGSIGNVNVDYITMYKADVPNPVAPTVKAANISLAPKHTVYLGETKQLHAAVEPANFTNTIVWKSDNPAVAIINSNGVVTGKSEGTATITAAIDGLKVSTLVTVRTKQALASVTLEAEPLSLHRNDQSALTISGTDSNGKPVDLSEASIEYVSSNTNVISIADGKLTAHNPGTATVSVKVTLDGLTIESNRLIVEVTTSMETIQQLVREYTGSGAIQHPLASQLTNSLEEAKHQHDLGHDKQAIKKLKDFQEHLNNPAMDKFITADVKEILNTDMKALLESLD